jgi:ribosomal protein S18 acetylase RimI-like enzyme
MLIRNAKVEDAESIGRIRVEAWRSAYRDFLPSQFLADLDPNKNLDGLREVILSPNPPFQLLIADVNGTVAGYAIYGKPRYNTQTRTLELWALNISPTSWRQGIGRSLITEVLVAARNELFNRVELWCIEGNSPAISLYESLGFARTGDERTTSGLTGHPLREVAFGYVP